MRPRTLWEDLPRSLADEVDALLEAGEAVQFQISGDMADEYAYGRRWLVLTNRRVFLAPDQGEGGLVQSALADIDGARVLPLVGGGLLQVERRDGPPMELYHTSSLHALFAEAPEAITRLAKGEKPTLPTLSERSRCGACDRLLPERDGICPFCISRWDTLKRIAAFVAPYRWRLAGLLVGSVLVTALGLVPPYIVRYVIDDVLEPGANGALSQAQGMALLGLLVGGLLAVQLCQWSLQLFVHLMRTDLSAWSCRDMRARLYQSLQLLPLRFIDKRPVGNLISRFTKDAERMEALLLIFAPFVLPNALLIVGILALLLSMSWQLTLYVLVPVPVVVLVSTRSYGQLERYWTRWSVRWSRLSAHLSESIAGLRTVKAFAQEEREARRFYARNEEVLDAGVQAERVSKLFAALSSFAMSCGVFLVWYFGGRRILHGELSLGVLMAFVSYLWQLYQPLQFFSSSSNTLAGAFAGAGRVFEVIDATPESPDERGPRRLPGLAGSVRFAQVTYGYDPGKPVLQGIDLEVKPGELIGLVGKSGAGKSTLISLVSRFYDVDRGTLEIDGIDIRDIRLRDLRRQIGIVSQEPFLFHDTILENIRYARPEAAFPEVMGAARAANAHEFIVNKPDGYDTMVGERGNRLSGGEKQRISIARALLHDPGILILDEATSALDTPTEKKVQEGIARLVQGRTTFAIAHRLSTLRNADRLVVLDEGRIVEVGTHQELMERGGLFHSLVTTQRQITAVIAVGG